MTTPIHAIILGGGLAGLTAAHRLLEIKPTWRICVLEAENRFGGVIQTLYPTIDGQTWTVELGADSIFSVTPYARQLVRRLRLEDSLVETKPGARSAYLMHRGQLVPLPAGWSSVGPRKPLAFMKSDLLSWPGRLRVLTEPWIPSAHTHHDESIASFFTRRMGREAFETLIEPLVGGIYGGDASTLSMAAALGDWVEAVRTHGSLTKALRYQTTSQSASSQDKGARYSQFFNFKQGTQTLIDALVDSLVNRGATLLLNQKAVQLEHEHATWKVRTSCGESFYAKTLLAALPANILSDLIAPLHPTLAGYLRAVPYRSAASINFLWPRETIGHPLDAAGFVIPRAEQKVLQACTWSNMKYPMRGPESHALIRGYCTTDAYARYDDTTMMRLMEEELQKILSIRTPSRWQRLTRFHARLPEYTMGHLQRVQAIESYARGLPHFTLCGCAYRGSGIPKVILNAEQAAHTLSTFVTE